MDPNQIANIDLPALVESAGVELSRSGHRLVGLCPFHDEKTPSFFIFQDADRTRYHCFGCQAHGDAIDFVKQIHGTDYRGAARILGVAPAGVIKADSRATQRRELVRRFRRWCSEQSTILGSFVRAGYRILDTMNIETLDWDFMAQVKAWEADLNILATGNDRQKYELFKRLGFRL